MASLALAEDVEARSEHLDIESSAVYTYDVQPVEGIVDVAIGLSVTAGRPDLQTGSTVTRYLLSHVSLGIPGDAVEVTVLDGSGVELTTERIAVEGGDIITMALGRSLAYRETADLTIRFALAHQSGQTRVNPAYVGFRAWVDGGLGQADVIVKIPDSFDAISAGVERFELRAGPEGNEYHALDVDPEQFQAFLSFTNDRQLQERVVDMEDVTVRLRFWPGQTVWAGNIATMLSNGLPLMRDAIGQPWPLDSDLIVIESNTAFTRGYGGSYDPESATIRLPDTADDQLTYHELAHVWISGDLFVERWIVEGLAEHYAATVAAELAGEPVSPPPPSSNPRVSSDLVLNRWLPSEEATEADDWAYRASWITIDAIADHVGDDALAEVMSAAAAGEIAYTGDLAAEAHIGLNDWRYFLDLLETRSEADAADLARIVSRWALTPYQSDQVTRRAATVEAASDLADAGGGWANPLGVRRMLATWEFDKADIAIAEAEGFLETRGRIASLTKPFTDEVPSTLEEIYESTDADEARAASIFSDALTSAEDLRQTHDALVVSRSIPTRIGLLGTDLQTELDSAIATYQRGSFDDVRPSTERILGDLRGAAAAGWIRIAIAGALLIAISGAVIIYRVHGRERVPTPN